MTQIWTAQNGSIVRRGHDPVLPGGYVRPSGPGYVRYEDLYVSGDTISQALTRLSASSPNANSDGTAYVTFPEGVFTFSDFKAGGSNIYGVIIPTQCKGFIGSGPGTLGTTASGTIFTMTPNSWTNSSPLQSSGQANPNSMIFRNTGTDNGMPLIFSQFQLAGTTQGDVDGKCYNGLTVFYPEAPTTVKDVLITGWYGDNGAPPGETFGLNIHGGRGPHKTIRVEADGRRTPGGQNFGTVGITFENLVGGEMHDCYAHHCQSAQIVLYQTSGVNTYNLELGSKDGDSGTNYFGGTSAWPLNHERTTGSSHYNTKFNILQGAHHQTHVTHSNDSYTYTDLVTSQSFAIDNGTLSIYNPTYTDIWGDGKFYVQTWTPYGNGDTQTTAPLVTTADDSTHLTYIWVHGPHYTIT